MPIDYNENSRFRKSKPIAVSGVETQGRWVRPGWLVERPSADKVRRYRVPSEHEGRPDLIAQSVYGSSELDWVLLVFNGVRDTLNWPRAGSVIEYPIDSVVVPEL